ncbi:HAD family hydrolase [Streptomyces sp. NRRL WC-3744]|uniref:HAD family hydrolase n=1 Tax=Streptomyces sp. NRRL WC-3744 TaxID=1463935 RepID=UPI0004C64413|nr:HAD-IA family hydrolase [Streptomyces sp. NRRL WC-3744]
MTAEYDAADAEEAWELLSAGPGPDCALFDFDGPLCRLFPDGSSMAVANALRTTVEAAGLLGVLSEGERTDKDPHVVLRAVHRARRDHDVGDLVARLEQQVTEGERTAARTAWPTPGAAEFVRWLAGRGTRLAVVTNNAAVAADDYLRDRNLRENFEDVHGRAADPDLMKPHPDVLHRALRGLGLPPDEAVMIGDTPTDFMAAERAGVRFVGIGRTAAKRQRMRDAGAKVVLASYDRLLRLIPR